MWQTGHKLAVDFITYELSLIITLKEYKVGEKQKQQAMARRTF
jgi:hypothetical protein